MFARFPRIVGLARSTLAFLSVLALLLAVLAPSTAVAGPGSEISGFVWADTDRDQSEELSEPYQEGVTVELVRVSDGVVVATTTTNGVGAYEFLNVADGTYQVVVTAPGAFRFPNAVGFNIDNDFSRQGTPPPGQPEKGVSAPITITGATTVSFLDAGMQPLTDITISQIAQPGECQDLADVGTPPFDTTNGGGTSTGTGAGACLLRTGDSATLEYSVALSGLPTGVSVDNVVVDFTISSSNGADMEFDGPGADNIPLGCLLAGVTPPSSIETLPNGDVVLHCNMGTFTNAAKPISIPVRALNSSTNNSSFVVGAVANATNGDAGRSNTVSGPEIQVTNGPRWDLSKAELASQSTPTVETINGVPTRGYHMEYTITLAQLATRGNTALTEPLTFVDTLNSFPNAVITGCRRSLASPAGTLTCPIGEAQGTDGFALQLSGINYELPSTVFVITLFVPETDVIRVLDPNWQPGQPVPTGSVPVSNDLTETDGWVDPDNNLNNGTGLEPGWDGTAVSGNNHVTNPPLQVAPPTPGPPSGGKRYFSPPVPADTPSLIGAGGQIGGEVTVMTDASTTITNPILCDVFDVSVYMLDTTLINVFQPPAGYVIEYAAGSNGTDLQTGPQNADGTWPPINSTPIQNDVNNCHTNTGPWVTQQATATDTVTALATQFGANWQNSVNMVRLRPIDPTTVLGIGSTLRLRAYMTARTRYNGGPHAGEAIAGNVTVPNEGSIPDPTSTTGRRSNEVTARFLPVAMSISKTSPQTQYLPGETVEWSITPTVTVGGEGERIHDVVVTDVVPANLDYDANCTEDALPFGVEASYNPATREVTFYYGNETIGTLPYALPTLTMCTTVSQLTPTGTTIVNRASVTSPDLSLQPGPAEASVVINGTGAFAVEKSVDYPLVEPGQTFTWNLEWMNTTSAISFQAPDLIDVLPFNGDGASSSLSDREQYESDFTGSHQLTGPLAQPTYTAGGTGPVAGTWYYSTLGPATIDGNPGAASNATPEAPGGAWLTQAEIQAGPGFGAVTAVRFVSTNAIVPGERISALIPQTAAPDQSGGRPVLDGVYVNRAVGFSTSLPTQPIRSNEPYVVMPGFSIGDRVWEDILGTGLFEGGTSPTPQGVPIEVVDSTGAVVGTATTSVAGLWAVTGLPAGTYTVRIPASAFQTGGVLEGYVVSTVGSNPDTAVGETQANKNTATADPATTGLVSSPITFSYTRDTDGLINGGNQPASAANDPHGLTDPLVPPGFKNLNMDLTVQAAPAIELDKTGSTTTVNRAGDTITYTYLVTNVGDTVLNNVTVTDVFTAPAGPAVTIACTGTTLQPGASMTCTSSPYTVTQADVDRGQILNSASTSGTSPGGITVTDDDTFTVTAPAAPAITLVKSADRTTANQVGDVINYTYLVTNTGNVTLNPVTVTDAFTAPAGPAVTVDCPVATLAPNASTTCTSSPYTVTQADVDNGRVVNTATATGTPPTGPDVTGNDDLDIPIPPDPSVEVVKSADRTTADRPGDVINYTFVVTNTGNVTLNPVRVTDVFTAPAGPALTIDCPETTLAADESMTCTGSPYTVTQADVDNGRVVNTATATGTPPTGPDVTDTDDLDIPIPPDPSVEVVKSADRTTADRPGDVINYTFVVTNTGNVTLNPVRVTDVFTAPAGPALTIDCPETTLAFGESMTCTGSPYTVTQADVDNGRVVNTATATGTPPTGPDVTDTDDLDTPIPPDPSIEVVKSADRTTANQPGDVINFTFLVTNTGNVTLNPVVVTDTFTAPAGPALTIDCPETTLAFGESMTCTGSPYTVTQADVDNGRVVNTATATGTPPTGPDVTDTDDLDTPIPPDPSIELVKSADRDGAEQVGDIINFTFVVTNTGNVTLDPVVVTDTLAPPAGPELTVTCPETALAFGESMTCTGSPYTVTQADVDNGALVNSATATGTPPTGPDVTSTDDLDLPIPPLPAISLVKSADRDRAERVGDVINFTFVVTNTGNVTLDPVTVTDTLAAPAGPEVTVTCPETALESQESMTCTGSPYTVTQADVDSGAVVNTATATGSRRGGGSPVTSPPSTVEVPVTPPPPAVASIPITGRSLLGLAAIGLLTVLVGVAATTRRRRNTDS